MVNISNPQERASADFEKAKRERLNPTPVSKYGKGDITSVQDANGNYVMIDRRTGKNPYTGEEVLTREKDQANRAELLKLQMSHPTTIYTDPNLEITGSPFPKGATIKASVNKTDQGTVYTYEQVGQSRVGKSGTLESQPPPENGSTETKYYAGPLELKQFKNAGPITQQAISSSSSQAPQTAYNFSNDPLFIGRARQSYNKAFQKFDIFIQDKIQKSSLSPGIKSTLAKKFSASPFDVAFYTALGTYPGLATSTTRVDTFSLKPRIISQTGEMTVTETGDAGVRFTSQKSAIQKEVPGKGFEGVGTAKIKIATPKGEIKDIPISFSVKGAVAKTGKIGEFSINVNKNTQYFKQGEEIIYTGSTRADVITQKQYGIIEEPSPTLGATKFIKSKGFGIANPDNTITLGSGGSGPTKILSFGNTQKVEEGLYTFRGIGQTNKQAKTFSQLFKIRTPTVETPSLSSFKQGGGLKISPVNSASQLSTEVSSASASLASKALNKISSQLAVTKVAPQTVFSLNVKPIVTLSSVSRLSQRTSQRQKTKQDLSLRTENIQNIKTNYKLLSIPIQKQIAPQASKSAFRQINTPLAGQQTSQASRTILKQASPLKSRNISNQVKIDQTPGTIAPIIPAILLRGSLIPRDSGSFKGGNKVRGYVPSFSALIYKIKGAYKGGRAKTGLDFRPITKNFSFLKSRNKAVKLKV